MKRPTMKDVGKAANVSVFTVSRSMTGGDGISDQTRTNVRRIADELGYIPNQLARGLKGGVTRTIGVLTANTNNLYYATLISSLERELQTQGYHCIVMDAVLDGRYRTDREDAFVAELLQHQVAAVVLTYRISDENMATLKREEIEMVFVDAEPPDDYSTYPSVNSDNYTGSHRLGEHMVWHGYAGPWAFVGFTSSWASRMPRQAGFVDAARGAGIDVDILEGGNDSSTAYEAVRDHLAASIESTGRPPRVIFAGNELLLLGTLKAIHERGLSVPSEIAVVSYDDFEWAVHIDPPMTVVDQHVPQLGASAGSVLLSALNEKVRSHDGERLVLPSTLIVRQSCGCGGPTRREHDGKEKQ